MEPTGNRAFWEMEKAARQWLSGRDPHQLAQCTGAHYNETDACLYLTCLNQELSVSWPDLQISPAIDEWLHLTLLHYLNLGDGTPPCNQVMAFGEIKDGLVRGTKFDHQAAFQLGKALGRKSPSAVADLCRKLGGQLIDSNADLCAEFFLFPYYPLVFKLWFADEDLEGSGRLFVTKSADHYMTIEDAVMCGTLLCDLLTQHAADLPNA